MRPLVPILADAACAWSAQLPTLLVGDAGLSERIAELDQWIALHLKELAQEQAYCTTSLVQSIQGIARVCIFGAPSFVRGELIRALVLSKALKMLYLVRSAASTGSGFWSYGGQELHAILGAALPGRVQSMDAQQLLESIESQKLVFSKGSFAFLTGAAHRSGAGGADFMLCERDIGRIMGVMGRARLIAATGEPARLECRVSNILFSEQRYWCEVLERYELVPARAFDGLS
jgi:hypothetical protein